MLAWMLLATVGLNPPDTTTCDIVEFNVVVRFDRDFRPESKMIQVIGWDLTHDGRFICRWYRGVRVLPLDAPCHWPAVRRLPSKRWEVQIDGVRVVCTGIARRMSDYDPEREDAMLRGVAERKGPWHGRVLPDDM